MSKDNVIQIKKPERFVDDPITDILQSGERKLLEEVLETGIAIFLSEYKEFKDDLGRKRIIRNGYLPEREIQTGIDPVSVKVPKPGIVNLMEKILLNLHQHCCLRILERQKAWRNLYPSST